MLTRLLKCLVAAATAAWLTWPDVALVRPGTVTTGGEPAPPAEVNSILDEIRLVPPTRAGRSGADKPQDLSKLPAFSAQALEAYRTDNYNTIAELRKRYKNDPDGFARRVPVRAAVLDAVDALQKSEKTPLRKTLKGPIDPKQKAIFLKQQAAPGEMIFELEQVLSQLRSVAEDGLEREKSKRWRAHFDFVQTRL